MSPFLGLITRGFIRRIPGRAIGAPARLVAISLALLLLVVPHPSLAAGDFPDTGSNAGRSAGARAAQAVTWNSFTPAGWVTGVPFASSVTAESPVGLDPLGDAYSVSTDGGVTWSAWSTTGLSTTSPVSTTHSILVSNLSLPDSATRNSIRFRVVEVGGAESVSPPYLVRVDASAPAVPQALAANPSFWSNTGGFAVNWSNPADAAGIAGAWYKLDAAPATPTDGAFVTTSNSIAGIVPENDGAHAVYVWLQDTLGRADQNNAANTMLYWDTTPPEPPSRMQGSPARQWSNVNKFSETWKNPNDMSAITGAYYRLNSLPTSATDGTYVNTTNTISNIQVPGDGRHDIYVWLVDGAGNVDAQALTGDPRVFWYDGTPPVSTMVVTPTLPATGWYTASVSAGFIVSDLPLDTGYPPVVNYQLDGGSWTPANSVLTFSTEGSHSLQYQARDKAGNTDAMRGFYFGIDKTAPEVALQADRLPNSTQWYTAAVTYTLSVTDLVSGAPQGFYRLNDGAWQGPSGPSTTFSLSAEGSYRIEYYGQDAANNRSLQNTVEAHVDATPPTTTMTVEGTAGENDWYVSNVTVHLEPQDNGAGVASTKYRINGGAWQTGTEFLLFGDASYDLQFYSTDLAGNAEDPASAQVKIDATAPAAPAGLTTAPSGWSRTNSFDAQWTSPADLSGVSGAYYKLGDLSGGGAPAGPKDGTPVTQTQSITGLTLPAEGAYRLYLWLRDTAGNADQKAAPGGTPPSGGPVLRYDATAPVTTVETQGTAGQGGWWLSPVTVTLTAADPASGVTSLHYRVDGGVWQQVNKNTATISITQPDKHVVEYYAEDVAGNVEAIQQFTARLDFTPPPAPAVVKVLPESWTRYNSFHIEWSTVTDLSNIGGAYVKFDAAPANATDGTFYPGSTQVNGVKAPSEGHHSTFVWLRDGAGNADNKTAVAVPDSVWYDGTPPTSSIAQSAASGLNGWYVKPVTFDVSATDAASGLLEVRYQIDDGAVQTANAAQLPPQTLETASRIVVTADGRHTIGIWAVDRAGNVEPAHVYDVAIDQTAPLASFSGPAGQVTQTQFEVTWTGNDNPDGSGLASYDVQVRDGYAGAWQDWLLQTKLTAAQFDGQRGHTYFFRVYGLDKAGNRQGLPGTWKVLVQPVQNGHFDTGTFSNWTTGGLLLSSVVGTTGPANVSTLAAELGSEVYGPSTTAPGQVPPGCATMTQAIGIPSLDQVRKPRIRFWYRVMTYDVMYSQRLQSYVDTLDVKLTDAQGNEIALLVRAGNPTSTFGQLYDTGWRFADLDLKAYAGRSATLSFANCNGPQNGQPDNMLNTWSFVDNIEIYDSSWIYVPFVVQPNPVAQSAGAVTEGQVPVSTVPASTEPATIGDEPLR